MYGKEKLMRKCHQCRDKDVELLTKWERFKNWLFYKINNIFFIDDFKDYTDNKYTQGYADGLTTGVESERAIQKAMQLRYNPEPVQSSGNEINNRLNALLSNADLHKIVTLDKAKGIIYIGGEKADNARLSNLKSEAEAILSFELWGLLHNTPKELAQKAMFLEGDDITQMRKGRTILYTLSTQNNILELLKSYTPK